MIRNKLIEKQIANTLDRFPKLRHRRNEEKKLWIIEGDLDICDTIGTYWNTFQVAIFLDEKYPNSVPVVFEISNIIPREQDRHISKEGVCCLDIAHKLLFWADRGIVLSEFMASKVYPFFANQLYFEKEGRFAGPEYAHRFFGVRQFYHDELNLNSDKIAISVLELILSKRLPSRNDLCFCGENAKFKKCHLEAVEFLLRVDNKQLQEDLAEFKSAYKNEPTSNEK